MNIKLFQIVPEKDTENVMFCDYDFTVKHGGVKREIYNKVFDGGLPVKGPDDVFQIFNTKLPDGYTERSMSVSDVVFCEELGTFFCDRYGWQALEGDVFND
jgi:hypothetical protein